MSRYQTARAAAALLLVGLAAGCPESTPPPDDDDVAGLPASAHASCQEDEGVILSTPSSHNDYLASGMDRYTTVEAPGGGLIYIYAQDQVSELQIRRVRSLLRFFLTDVPGSQFGSDKGAVASSMAEHGAVLVMPNGAHEEGNEPQLEAQPLYASETPVEGSTWYMTDDWDHRDAAFEEIFHLVHDLGIGTWVAGALPEYQALLDAEAREAVEDGRWGIPIDPYVEQWLLELEAEGSLAQEYIASVIDSYYGLWGAWHESPGGMWGIYIAGTRDEVAALDPDGMALLEAFLPPYLSCEIRLDPGFEGTFSLEFDPDASYTHKSRYLTRVTLTGDRDSGLRGNDQDNTLRGNAGDNLLDGGAGEDVVVYCDAMSEYQVDVQGDTTVVQGPDGRDTLQRIESVHFADQILDLQAR
jgi:hypothetical protein